MQVTTVTHPSSLYALFVLYVLNLTKLTIFCIVIHPNRPGCPATLMRIATRNLETLNEIISIVQPSNAASGSKRIHSEILL
jgi:hypothetical protein